MNLGDGLEKAVRVVHGHGQHVGDALASVAHFQGFPVEPFPLARLARHVHVGQEVHLDRLHAGPFARLAASSRYVEGEATLFVAPDFGFRKQGELRSNQVHQPRVSGGVGARCASDGTLVDRDAFVDVVQPRDFLVGEGNADVLVQMVQQRRQKGLVDKRAFAAPADPTDADQAAQRQFQVDRLQVVSGRAFQDEVLPVASSSLCGHLDALDAVQVLGGQRVRR